VFRRNRGDVEILATKTTKLGVARSALRCRNTVRNSAAISRHLLGTPSSACGPQSANVEAGAKALERLNESEMIVFR